MTGCHNGFAGSGSARAEGSKTYSRAQVRQRANQRSGGMMMSWLLLSNWGAIFVWVKSDAHRQGAILITMR